MGYWEGNDDTPVGDPLLGKVMRYLFLAGVLYGLYRLVIYFKC